MNGFLFTADGELICEIKEPFKISYKDSRTIKIQCTNCAKVKDAKIPDNAFDELFGLETICNNLTGFSLPTVKCTHRCDAQTIGLCEFIGWRKQE